MARGVGGEAPDRTVLRSKTISALLLEIFGRFAPSISALEPVRSLSLAAPASGLHAARNCQLLVRIKRPALATARASLGLRPHALRASTLLTRAHDVVALFIRPFENVVTKIEKERIRLQKIMDAAAKQQQKLKVAEDQEKKRQALRAAKEREKERAKLFRSADAHRKIVLGGLTIAAGADEWDPAEIVGALLLVGEKMGTHESLRGQLREKGISHLEAREAARQAAKS